MSPRACVLLRHTSHYRCDVFSAGLRRHGYQIEPRWQRAPRPHDLLLIWNRNRSTDPIARIYEAAGARVLVTENGYLDRGPAGEKFYALALDGHNGSGRWFVGDGPRFEIDEEPWRTGGSKVLVLPQRGIGLQGVAMPSGWPGGVVKRLQAMTRRELVLRQHPGHQRVEKPLDFRDVWCAVTWGSGAGIKALLAGIPVFHQLPCWIGASGAAPLADEIERCHTPDRRLVWTRVSWAQWKLDEIGSGEEFDRLLNEEDRGLFCGAHTSLPARRSSNGDGDRSAGRERVAQGRDGA